MRVSEREPETYKGNKVVLDEDEELLVEKKVIKRLFVDKDGQAFVMAKDEETGDLYKKSIYALQGG